MGWALEVGLRKACSGRRIEPDGSAAPPNQVSVPYGRKPSRAQPQAQPQPPHRSIRSAGELHRRKQPPLQSAYGWRRRQIDHHRADRRAQAGLDQERRRGGRTRLSGAAVELVVQLVAPRLGVLPRRIGSADRRRGELARPQREDSFARDRIDEAGGVAEQHHPDGRSRVDVGGGERRGRPCVARRRPAGANHASVICCMRPLDAASAWAHVPTADVPARKGPEVAARIVDEPDDDLQISGRPHAAGGDELRSGERPRHFADDAGRPSAPRITAPAPTIRRRARCVHRRPVVKILWHARSSRRPVDRGFCSAASKDSGRRRQEYWQAGRPSRSPGPPRSGRGESPGQTRVFDTVEQVSARGRDAAAAAFSVDGCRHQGDGCPAGGAARRRPRRSSSDDSDLETSTSSWRITRPGERIQRQNDRTKNCVHAIVPAMANAEFRAQPELSIPRRRVAARKRRRRVGGKAPARRSRHVIVLGSSSGATHAKKSSTPSTPRTKLDFIFLPQKGPGGGGGGRPRPGKPPSGPDRAEQAGAGGAELLKPAIPRRRWCAVRPSTPSKRCRARSKLGVDRPRRQQRPRHRRRQRHRQRYRRWNRRGLWRRRVSDRQWRRHPRCYGK